MSNRRKNNHYHYAEKFDDRNRQSAKGVKAFMPFKSVIISLVVLLMFGLICTTFSVYVSENDPADNPDHPPILMEARNMKAARDIAITGADMDISPTGDGWMTMNGGGYFIFDNTNSNWPDVQMLVGRRHTYGGDGVFCRKYNMSKISNTNLYALQISDWSTSGDGTHIYDIVFVSGASDWGADENTSPVDRRTYASKRSAVYSSSGASFTSTGVYACYVANGNNDCSVTISTITSSGYGYYNYDQTIRSYTKNASTGGNYNQINDGGTIAGSSYKLNGNSSSTASTESEGKVVAAKTATVTLKATVNSGYRFVGWYDGSNNPLSNGTGGYSIGTGSDNKPYISYTCTNAREIRARFIKTYDVTVQRMSGYNGTAPTGSSTVDIGNSVTINATTPQGVNFTGWSISGSYSGGSTSSASTTITPTSDITATANYSLAAPKNLTLTYEAYKILGYSSYSPTANTGQTSTASGSGSSISYSYDIAQASGSTVSLTKDTDFSVDSYGAVSASVPGKYVVTMTVTDTCYGLSSSASKTATVEVKPVTPSFTYRVQGYTGGIVEGITGKSASTPYKIQINSGSAFQIKSGLPGISGYSYAWTMTDGNASANYTGIQIIDKASDSGTVLHDTPAGDYTYGISLKASYNGVESEAATATIYYSVTADFLTPKHLNFDNTYDDPDTSEDESNTVQKIYAVDNSVSQIYAAFSAGGVDFDTILYFSRNNRDFTPIQIFTDLAFTLNGKTYDAQPNDAAHKTVRPYTTDTTNNYLIFNLPVIAQLANNGSAVNETVNVMQRSGVKYFKSYVDDFRNNRVAADEHELHTTVGTSSAAGARPIYFKDSNTYTDTRLMAYFLNSSGEMTYQTAADFNDVVTQIESGRTDRTGIYRFYAPSDAVSVTFAYTTITGYVLPAVSGESLNFTADKTIFPAMTSTVDLDPDYNMYKISSRTEDSNGIYDYTGAWTNLDMDS